MNKAKEMNQGQVKSSNLEPESEISRRELLKRLSPLGKVELDSSRCTGCGLCSVECPTEALVISSSEQTDAFQLLFKHGNCVACGQCVEICPENCLVVERVLELDKVGSQSVLFEDTVVRCSECGGFVGSKAMVDNIKSRMLATGRFPADRFELCFACKAKSSLLGN
ncbi:4Fe-4S dicluster domain-containing protein [Candidatus Omnitrophota bacterium]